MRDFYFCKSEDIFIFVGNHFLNFIQLNDWHIILSKFKKPINLVANH